MVEHDPRETTTLPFDTRKKFVRLNRIRDGGFVEFEFAIGDPELALELIMPVQAYHEFCRANGVVYLSDSFSEHSSNVAGPLQPIPKDGDRTAMPRAFTKSLHSHKGGN